jgi:arsenate reductase (thioredoxin)
MMQLTFRSLLCRAAVLLAILLAPSSAPRADEAAGEKTIVFVCLHGVVNSQMAAAYFNKVAKERGLSFTAVSRGIDLYQSIPVRIQDGLALDGLEPANAPLALTPEEAGRASQVLAFDIIPAEQRGRANVTYWSGVPIGVDNYETTRDEIVRRVDALIPTLANEKAK